MSYRFNRQNVNKFFITIRREQRGGTLVLMAVLILTVVMTITFSISEIARLGLKMSGNQNNSTKAYFAAEAGAERILWEIRSNSFVPSDNGCNNDGSEYKFCFLFEPTGNLDSCQLVINNCGITERQVLDNNSEYSLRYQYNLPDTSLKSLGKFQDVQRIVELVY